MLWLHRILVGAPGSSFFNLPITSSTSHHILQPFRRFPTSQLILQSFHHFTYVTAHSPTIPSLYLRHSSFSNPSVASPTSQFILQPFFLFSYVTSSSLNSPGEPTMYICLQIFNNSLPRVIICKTNSQVSSL